MLYVIIILSTIEKEVLIMRICFDDFLEFVSRPSVEEDIIIPDDEISIKVDDEFNQLVADGAISIDGTLKLQ